MKYLLKLCLMFLSLGLLVSPVAHAAGFDCKKASQPIELAICGDKTLSGEDEDLNDAYTYLLAQCPEVAVHADLRATQGHWLAEIRKDFRKGGPEATDRLKAAYRARNETLGQLLARCNPVQGPVQATVTIVRDTVHNNDRPFIETNPPQAGWRINRVLFGDFDAAPPPYIGGLKDFFARHDATSEAFGFYYPSLILNKGNLLELHVGGLYYEEGFPRSYPYGGPRLFDVRTGREVQFKELFIDPDAPGLKQYLKERLLAVAKAQLATISQTDAQAHGEQYQECLKAWVKGGVLMYSEFEADGSIRLSYWTCSLVRPSGKRQYDPAGKSLDDLKVGVTPARIRQYLSPYGKSLLLGEGNVLAPAH